MAKKDQWVFPVRKDRPDHRAVKDFRVPKDCPVRRVKKARKDCLDRTDQKATGAKLACPDFRETMDRVADQANPVRRVHPAGMDVTARMECPACRGDPDRLDCPDFPERPVETDRRVNRRSVTLVHRAKRANPVWPEYLDYPGHRAEMDFRARKAIEAILDHRVHEVLPAKWDRPVIQVSALSDRRAIRVT